MRGKLALKVGLVILAVTLCGTFSPESPAQKPNHPAPRRRCTSASAVTMRSRRSRMIFLAGWPRINR
jgi:hypothetical protein